MWARSLIKTRLTLSRGLGARCKSSPHALMSKAVCNLYSTDGKTSDVAEVTGVPEVLHIADNCVERLRSLEAGGETLRVLVDGGGCSGFQYKFDLDAHELDEDDRVFERDGARVIIDRDSLQMLRGATLSYEDELIRSGFVIAANPLADVSCSCGTSFSLKL